MTPSPFAHPELLLPGAVLWAFFGLALLVAFRRGEGRLQRLLGAAPGRAARGARDLLLWIALGALLVAAVGPRHGTRELRVPASGLDAVFLLDLSRSMDAADTPPSRLVRARAVAEGVLARLGEGDRAALAVFAGQAAVLTPLTPDKNALAEMLPALDTRLMAHTASKGRDAIEHLLPTYDSSGLRPRVLFVISDGEVGAIGADLVATLAQKEIRVLAALVGTETGARIPESSRWMLDGDGRPVVTRREVGRLAPLLSATGGRAFLADAWGELDLEAVTAELRREAIPSSDGTIRRRIPVTWVALPAGLALLLLLAEAWPGPWRPSRRGAHPKPATPRGAWKPATLALLVGASTVPDAATPQERPDTTDPRRALERRLLTEAADAELLVELGLERVRAGDADEARHAWRAAAARARQPTTAALAWFDLGVLALEQGRLDDARDAFFDATTASAADPVLDRKVKFNLEWTLAALRARDEPPPSPSPLEEPSANEDAEEPADEPEAPTEREESAEREQQGSRDGESAEDPAEAEDGDGSGGEPEAAPPAPPPLSPEEVRRWLEQVDDDVRAAIEARLAETRKAERSGPRW